MDSTWNRYTFEDENLPDWFVKDEKKYNSWKIPLPEDLVEYYRKREEALNSKPIKKVMEAKARKKKRAMQKHEKAKKKAEAIMNNAEIDDREKAKQVKA